jgi:hypothetical protein
MTRRVERILYVGIGDERDSEAAALRGAAGKGKVTVVRPGVAPGRDFVDGLGLDPARATLARDLLEESEAADVVAQLMLVYRDAERGGPPLERVVVSGHSGGSGVYNEETHRVLAFDDLVRLAEIFPRAAAQVEDVMFSACNSGWEGKLEAYHQRAFPQLQTMWAYVDTSPRGGGRGAEEHMRVWEAASRGDAPARVDRRRIAARADLPRERNIATWNVESGYRSTAQHPFEEALREALWAEEQLATASSSKRELRAGYDALQRLVGHRRFRELGEGERAIHLAKLDEAKARLGIR